MEKKHKSSGTGDKSLRNSNDTKRDYISVLPDEILHSIFSFLTARDAAHASLVSRRWRYLCASVPELYFHWENMFVTPEISNTGPCLCQLNSEKFVKSVDQYLKFYAGQKVKKIHIHFCLGRDHACYLDQWISFAARMGVERLLLGLSCKKFITSGQTIHNHDLYVFPCHLLTSGALSKLKYLYLCSAILGPNFTDEFSNLQKLVLIQVPLSQRDVHTIFCSCFKLEFLTLDRCGLPDHKLCICSSLCTLKSLRLCHCSGVKEIELSSNSLTQFDYIGEEIKLSFLGVPNLNRVYFNVPSESGYENIFSQIGRALPSIKTISVLTRTYQLESLPRGLTAFSKIEHLELYIKFEFDTEKMIAIVRTCPLLKKLHIEIRCVPLAHDEHSRVNDHEPPNDIHHHLKTVEIGGFCGIRNHIGFAIYLLKHAVALACMVIDPKAKFCSGRTFGERASWDEGEHERVYEQLKAQVCSKNLVLIIR